MPAKPSSSKTPKGTKRLEPAYVDFVFRVHADGRRERTATVYAQDQAGTIRPVRGRLDGDVGKFAAEAVAEVVELGRPRQCLPASPDRSAAAAS